MAQNDKDKRERIRRYRALAEECRRNAAATKNLADRKRLTRVAESHEKMAKELEATLTKRSPLK